MTEHLIINALLILGVYTLFASGMLFNSVKLWVFQRFHILEKNRTKYLKPVMLCPPCMSSIYGTAYYWVIYTEPSWQEYPIYLLSLLGIMVILTRIINEI